MSAAQPTVKQIWQWLEQIPDPEIPVISIVDLGVVRDVCLQGNNVNVVITPTYSGCPAMREIAESITTELTDHGIEHFNLETRIAPAWTTDWMSDEGRTKLEAYGIATPQANGGPKHCPQCKSTTVEKISQFGSTPCKAQWRCLDCLEPFEYFKCI
ncbi:MAG: 1,2-phenylacetyl-CoA epoxidase subunit PaaD [Granulosicoccaceae bacterium]